MMTNKYPRLRSHTRRRKSGRVVTYYFYDMRGTGRPDEALGTDYDEAIKRWEEIHALRPRIAGTLEEAFGRWEKEALPQYANHETRKSYARQLRNIRPVFGASTWDAITMVHLKGYLKARTAKVQGNREMSLLSIIWNWARGEGLTERAWPAAGMERSGWKNKENARLVEVTDEMFDAVYQQADQVLRDSLDIATATGLRVTDVRTVAMPRDGMLRIQASKTAKPAYFDVSLSPVLSAVLERRKATRANHVMLLSTPTGRPVSYSMLRGRWEKARENAAKKAENEGRAELAEKIRHMILRDMRKRASDMADTLEEASHLLQHSSIQITQKHYRTKPVKLRAVR